MADELKVPTPEEVRAELEANAQTLDALTALNRAVTCSSRLPMGLGDKPLRAFSPSDLVCATVDALAYRKHLRSLLRVAQKFHKEG